MNKEERWATFINRYPQFSEPDAVVSLKARGLKRLMAQCHDDGVKEERGKLPDAPDFLKDIFH